jgi:hypothetical protein
LRERKKSVAAILNRWNAFTNNRRSLGAMSDGFWPVVLIVAVVIAWVLSKIVFYMKKSEQQWRNVDKSKLKEWEDDE